MSLVGRRLPGGQANQGVRSRSKRQLGSIGKRDERSDGGRIGRIGFVLVRPFFARVLGSIGEARREAELPSKGCWESNCQGTRGSVGRVAARLHPESIETRG